MSEMTITATGLVKQFKNVRAVDGLTFQVARGETYGLIGPDGAGKSTTIRTLLGLLTRTAGESRILGFDTLREPYAIRERTGYIAQQFALPGTLTVMENMQFFAGIHQVSREQQKKRIPDLLDFAGLAEFTRRPAGRLSGGMKKKLALACSLVHEPEVMLLDEPTLGVDPVSRREFWSLLGDLQAQKGLTILVCTPYMDEAERCTQIGLIYQGRLFASGTPGDIKAMLPGRLLEMTPGQIAPAQAILGPMEGVLEVQTYGDKLHIFVDEPALRQAQMETALQTAGIPIHAFRLIEVRMEEAFISLVRKQANLQTGGRQ
jgi:ABC-2 type transport system ATP-binding protein